MTGAANRSENGLARVSFARPVAREPRISAPYVPGRRHERYWTEAELAVIRDHYDTKGPA